MKNDNEPTIDSLPTDTDPPQVPLFVQLDQREMANEIPTAHRRLDMIEQELQLPSPDHQTIIALMVLVNSVVDLSRGALSDDPQKFVDAARSNLEQRLRARSTT